MPSWKEAHYTRAAEFLRLIGSALPAGSPPRPLIASAPIAPVPPPAVVPPLAKLDAPASPIPPPPAAPTAGAVFKKIPWKK